MVTVSFSTSQRIFDLFVAASCAQFGYQTMVPSPYSPGDVIPNPQTPAEFAQRTIINFATEVVKNYQGNVAATTARHNAMQQVDQAITADPIVVVVS